MILFRLAFLTVIIEVVMHPVFSQALKLHVHQMISYNRTSSYARIAAELLRTTIIAIFQEFEAKAF
jgi:hypothetical protein